MLKPVQYSTAMDHIFISKSKAKQTLDLLEHGFLGHVLPPERLAGLPLPQREQLVVRQRVGRRLDVQRLVLGARVAGCQHRVGPDVRLVDEHHLGVAVAEDDCLVRGRAGGEELPDVGEPVAREVAGHGVGVGDARGLGGPADAHLAA